MQMNRRLGCMLRDSSDLFSQSTGTRTTSIQPSVQPYSRDDTAELHQRNSPYEGGCLIVKSPGGGESFVC